MGTEGGPRSMGRALLQEADASGDLLLILCLRLR